MVKVDWYVLPNGEVSPRLPTSVEPSVLRATDVADGAHRHRTQVRRRRWRWLAAAAVGVVLYSIRELVADGWPAFVAVAISLVLWRAFRRRPSRLAKASSSFAGAAACGFGAFLALFLAYRCLPNSFTTAQAIAVQDGARRLRDFALVWLSPDLRTVAGILLLAFAMSVVFSIRGLVRRVTTWQAVGQRLLIALVALCTFAMPTVEAVDGALDRHQDALIAAAEQADYDIRQFREREQRANRQVVAAESISAATTTGIDLGPGREFFESRAVQFAEQDWSPPQAGDARRQPFAEFAAAAWADEQFEWWHPRFEGQRPAGDSRSRSRAPAPEDPRVEAVRRPIHTAADFHAAEAAKASLVTERARQRSAALRAEAVASEAIDYCHAVFVDAIGSLSPNARHLAGQYLKLLLGRAAEAAGGSALASIREATLPRLATAGAAARNLALSMVLEVSIGTAGSRPEAPATDHAAIVHEIQELRERWAWPSDDAYYRDQVWQKLMVLRDALPPDEYLDLTRQMGLSPVRPSTSDVLADVLGKPIPLSEWARPEWSGFLGGKLPMAELRAVELARPTFRPMLR